MTECHACGGSMTVVPSFDPRFDLLECSDCGRPVKLIPKGVPRPRGTRPARRADMNRILRSARRMKMRREGP